MTEKPRNGSPRFSGCVFDLDGTLIDSYSAINLSLNEVLAAFGEPPIGREETRRLVGNGLEALMRKVLGPERAPLGVDMFRKSYARSGPEMTELLPGAEQVTRDLASRGVPLAVASNKPLQFSIQLLEELGLAPRFRVIAGPTPEFPPKPDPAMVVAALGAMGVPPSSSLFVGDMPIDVETARAVGMPVAVLPTGSSSREELESARPDYLVDSLTDILDLFAD
ncbi:MAG: HAD family hydrolase [Acidobacteria bacterium]|nr:HAD family hydrolase [Acidobacteriota bacterium]MCG3192930.1 Phosphoglycolate phosphatase [Thermoanaerobaculia bacterium]MCK6683819.1 HAD family hydrolase [Thermoanaerobaculia bacterium]